MKHDTDIYILALRLSSILTRYVKRHKYDVDIGRSTRSKTKKSTIELVFYFRKEPITTINVHGFGFGSLNDYRALKDQLVKCKLPGDCINEMLETIKGKQWHTTNSLANGITEKTIVRLVESLPCSRIDDFKLEFEHEIILSLSDRKDYLEVSSSYVNDHDRELGRMLFTYYNEDGKLMRHFNTGSSVLDIASVLKEVNFV